ncbi:MAG: efflux RND transporter permease subunit [Rhizobacter sp.]|nr:efflux RND transporter permease subunit [Chlorobiales bacterium]
MWLTKLALRYPITTVLATIMIVFIGVISFIQIPVDLLPNISIPTVSVVTYYNGAGPLDMEQTVTRPIERTVSSVNDVDYVQSSTREGVSQTRIFFNFGTNVDVSVVDVIQRINRIVATLPTGISTPVVIKFDPTQQPVCNLSVSGNIDERDLRDLAYNVIEPQIAQISGVAAAGVQGGRIRQINITTDRQRLEALKIPVSDITDAIARSNLILPSGDLKSGRFDYSLRTESQFNVVEPMGNIVVRVAEGVPIRVRDVAKVEDSFEEQTQLVRVDGKSGITLRVQKTSGANSIDVVDRVIAALPNLRGVPQGVSVRLVNDQSLYIRQSASNLQHEGLIGAVLAMIIIFIFLQSLSATVIIAIAIPISLLVTFIVFYFTGTTFNIMTLGGLALGIGRLVDDSIVELEVIERQYRAMQPGESRIEATLRAAKEVASPILISTITTVIVFLPVIFLQGVSKFLFTPLAITIGVALFASFFVSRTITPLLCYRFLKDEHKEKKSDNWFSKWLDKTKQATAAWFAGVDEGYQRILESTLKHRRAVILSVVGFCVLSFGLIFFIGTEFFPDQDESQFNVNVRLPVGTRVEETQKFVQQLEGIIKAEVGEELQAVVADIGVPSARSGNLFGGNGGSHAAGIQVALIPPEERKRSVFEIMKAVRPKLAGFPDARVFVNSGGLLKFLLNFGSGAPIDVEIRGFDIEDGNRLAQEVFAIVRGVQGATDVQVSRESNLPELRIRINREKAGALGISIAQISNTITTSINGATASVFTDPLSGNQYNIVVRLDEDYRSRITDLKNLVVSAPNGEQVRLGNLVEISEESSPVQIDRKRQQRLINVTGNVQGRDLGSVANDIRTKLASVQVPQGYELRITGNVEQQQKAFGGLFLAFGLAIVLVYILMSSQFQSLIEPLIIMMTVPLGIAGVLWMLFLTNTTLSVTSFQGVIVMVGIVVANGVLLVDYTNHLRMTGMGLEEAIIKAGRTRLKPILMTALATVLGLLPIAIGLGGQSAQAPLAIAVVGGLIVSTVLTLVFVPAVYVAIEHRLKRDPKDRLAREKEVDDAIARIEHA